MNVLGKYVIAKMNKNIADVFSFWHELWNDEHDGIFGQFKMNSENCWAKTLIRCKPYVRLTLSTNIKVDYHILVTVTILRTNKQPSYISYVQKVYLRDVYL